MSSMSAPRHGSPQIPDQRPHHNGGHGRAHDDSALGRRELDGFEIDPSDNADEVLADLDADAFEEVAIHDSRLGHAGRGDHFSHTRLHSPSYRWGVADLAAAFGLATVMLALIVLDWAMLAGVPS